MDDWLLWIYLINAVLLIDHELDSAYFKEWEMMRLPGGIGFFLLLHIPLFGLVLWGLVLLAKGYPQGVYFSVALGLLGVSANAIHGAFLLKGRKEFKTAPSLILLGSILIVSLIQLGIAVPLLD